MATVVHEGAWSLVVATEHAPASFVASGVLKDYETIASTSGTGSRVRALVELKAVTGGLRPRAMLGGEFAPEQGTGITFAVDHSGALGLGAAATCPSLIGGSSLVAGLPLEFARAVLDGLVRVKCATTTTAGVLHVDRAGHDEVDSSQMVFERASGLLRCVLTASVGGADIDEERLRELLRG